MAWTANGIGASGGEYIGRIIRPGSDAPSPMFFEAALRKLDTSASRTLVVGDDVLTDCAGAKAVGASSLLVRTGKYDPRLFEAHRQNVDAVIEGIADFPRWWMSGNTAGHLRQG